MDIIQWKAIVIRVFRTGECSPFLPIRQTWPDYPYSSGVGSYYRTGCPRRRGQFESPDHLSHLFSSSRRSNPTFVPGWSKKYRITKPPLQLIGGGLLSLPGERGIVGVALVCSVSQNCRPSDLGKELRGTSMHYLCIGLLNRFEIWMLFTK